LWNGLRSLSSEVSGEEREGEGVQGEAHGAMVIDCSCRMCGREARES
jgi:hypothetical protein